MLSCDPLGGAILAAHDTAIQRFSTKIEQLELEAAKLRLNPFERQISKLYVKNMKYHLVVFS